MVEDDNEDEKEESSTHITARTVRKHNLIPGVDNEHLALAGAGAALLVAGVTWVTSQQGKDLIEKLLSRPPALPSSNQNPQLSPPPPPAPPAEPEPIANEPTAAVEDTTANLNISPPPVTNNAELEEIDHKNFQTRRKKDSIVTPSPFGAKISSG